MARSKIGRRSNEWFRSFLRHIDALSHQQCSFHLCYSLLHVVKYSAGRGQNCLAAKSAPASIARVATAAWRGPRRHRRTVRACARCDSVLVALVSSSTHPLAVLHRPSPRRVIDGCTQSHLAGCDWPTSCAAPSASPSQSQPARRTAHEHCLLQRVSRCRLRFPRPSLCPSLCPRHQRELSEQRRGQSAFAVSPSAAVHPVRRRAATSRHQTHRSGAHSDRSTAQRRRRLHAHPLPHPPSPSRTWATELVACRPVIVAAEGEKRFPPAGPWGAAPRTRRPQGDEGRT